MTPERWRRIGELFEAAVRIDPAGREAWLRAACGGDDELRTEVGRLLAQHERVTGAESRRPPGRRVRLGSDGERASPRRSPLATSGAGRWVRGRAGQRESAALLRGGRSRRRRSSSRSPSYGSRAGTTVRAVDRLHPHPGGLGPLESRRPRRTDATIARVDGTIILVLVGLIALLGSRCPITLTLLQALELWAVGLLAGRVSLRRIPADAEVLAAW